MIFQKLYAGQQVCCNCIHYQQHYYRGKKRYHEVYCGHCMESRIKARKTRRPDQTCELWTPKASAEKEEK